jgi:hypothetical protein
MRKRMDASYSDDQVELSSQRLIEIYKTAGLEEIRVIPQGLFSTPLAEVPLSPTLITRPLAKLACALDTAAETVGRPLLHYLSWNLIAVGRKSQ